MRLGILDELNKELTRLFMAGSRFAVNDPRLQRLAGQLNEAGTKSPVLKKLAESCAALVAAKPEETSGMLSELSLLLTAVLHTQNETELATDFEKADTDGDGILSGGQQNYSVIFPLISFLSQKDATFGADNLKTLIENAADFRLFPYMSRALEYKPFDSLSKAILAAGKDIIYYLEKDFNMQGGKSDAKRLALISELDSVRGEQIALEVTEAETQYEITVEALRALGKFKRHEKLLLSFADDKKQEIREAAMSGLASMLSEDGLKKILEYLNSKKYACAVRPASAIAERGFSLAVLDIVQTVFNNAKEDKKLLADAEKLLPALANKCYPEIFGFYRHMVDSAESVGCVKSRGWENLRLYSAMIENLQGMEMRATADFYDYYSKARHVIPTVWASHYLALLASDTSVFSKELTYSKLGILYKDNKIDLTLNSINLLNLDNRWFDVFAGKKRYETIAAALSKIQAFEHKSQKSIKDAAFECVNNFNGRESYYMFAELMLNLINISSQKEIQQLADTLLKGFSKSEKGYIYYFQSKDYQEVFRKLYGSNPEKLKHYADKAANDKSSFAYKIFEYILSVVQEEK